MDEGAWLNIQSSRLRSLPHLMALFKKCVSHELEKMDRLASISASLQTPCMMTLYKNKRVHEHTSTYLQTERREKREHCHKHLHAMTRVLNTLSTEITVNQ